MSEPERPLLVPDLTKPAGAEVDAQGNVKCVTCGRTLPQAEADVVGLGYRCAACGANASADDLNANLDAPDRARVSPPLDGRKFLVAGAVFLIVALVMGIMGWDIGWHNDLRSGSAFVSICIAAIGSFAIGLANLRRRR